MDESLVRREIGTEIEIDAQPARVWAVLTDFSSYPEWNTFLHWVEGRIAEGERIRFCFELPRGFRFKVGATILNVIPERALRWAGVFLTSRVFCAEHYFELTSSPGGRTRFSHGEIFTGLLLPLAWIILRISGPRVYEDMNHELKRRVEFYVAQPSRPVGSTQGNSI
jgi:hypothetical protein